MKEYKAFPDREVDDDWRVEMIDYDSDGSIYVAIFSGPEAMERAQEYAIWKNHQQFSVT